MATSYANPGGTGDRTADITVTTDAVTGGGVGPFELVDGVQANSYFWANGQTGRRVTFYFNGDSKVIDEAKWYQNGPATQGTWKWQAGNNGSSWTDISANFNLNGGGAGDPIGDLSANTTGYLYYSMLQVSGTTTDGPWIREIEFKIDVGASPSVEAVLDTTEAPDVVAFTGTILISGTIAATEASDVVGITGFVGPVVSGSLSATDGSDTASFSQGANVDGVLSTIEGLDVAAFNDGSLAGMLAAIEEGDTTSMHLTGRRHPYPVICVLAG